jgi:phosphoglycerol transferase MdoB-like AlkP superfamily enzyme
MSVFKNATIQKWFFYIFVVIASFSLVYAFANITIVVFLEKPLNYQWLYYSDFLGSEEAKNAMQANLSVTTIFNLLFYVLSLFLLSAILLNIYQWVISKKYLKQTILVFIILMVGVLGFKSYRAAANWTKGQEENAVAAMLKSIVKSDSDASFYSISVPENMLPFETAFEKNENTPFYTDTNHKVKNVLFIVLESAGAVYFDEYGGQYNLSSNLNRLAERSLIIENMYAHAPSTNRSLVSILGSVYPELTYKSITQELPDIEMPTISSVLKSKGYRTSFFSSANLNFQNCNEFLKYRDFDIVEDFSTIDCSEQFTMKNEDYKESNGIDDLCLADCLNSWLEEDTSGNFFSVLWTVQGHYPYFFNGTEEDFGVSDINFNRYLNALKHNDELVNKVMQNLEQKGLDSSTLVVVVGDHGEAFGQHGQFGHATALYEENVKVPLYFINPVLFSGERKNDIAGMKDLATTALAIINIETPKTWQGRNLLSTSSDENFYFAPWSDYLFAYRKANKKFIFNETRNTVEVYDLDEDKKEKNNIYTTTPETEIDYARKRLAAWLQSDHAFVQN